MDLFLRQLVLVLFACGAFPLLSAAKVLDALTLRDLELVASVNGTHNGVCDYLAKPRLKYSKGLLRTMLSGPLDQRQEISKRQSIVSVLVKDPASVIRFERLLGSIAEREKAISAFDAKLSYPALSKLSASLFFTSSWLRAFNKSPSVINARHFLEYFTPLAVFALEHAVLKLASAHLENKVGGRHTGSNVCCGEMQTLGPAIPSNPWSAASARVSFMALRSSAEHGVNSHRHGAGCDGSCIESKSVKAGSPVWIKGVIKIAQFSHATHHIAGILYSLFALRARMEIVNTLYQDIVALVELLSDCSGLAELVSSCPVLSEEISLAGVEVIQKLVPAKYFKKGARLTVISGVGATLTAYSALQNNADALESLMQNIALLDVYVAVARTMIDAQGTGAAFCFAQFVSGSNPYLEVVKGWHPMLNRAMPTANTFVAGAEGIPRKYILSGPNGGGKSSFLRMLGVNVVLAQVFGIAAAEKCVLSIFSKIVSFMTVVDDIGAGQSSFIARMIRSSDCLEQQKSLLATQYCLALLDDSVGQGTSIERGERTACQFVTAMGEHENSVLIAATHYDTVKDLGRDFKNGFANIRMRFTRNLDGSACPEYQVEPGVSDSADVGVLQGQG